MLIIGHRGDRKNFEDNTINGIESAFNKGADGVEIDVYYSSTKGVYLTHKFLHDPGKNYPKLEEVIERFSKMGKLQIEIKQPEVTVVQKVCKLIEKYKIENYELTSSILPLLKYVREVLPSAAIGMIVKPYLIEEWMTEELKNYLLMNYLKLTGSNSIWLSEPEGFWNKERVIKFHDSGYKVNSHLISDSRKVYERYEKLGIDSCTADNLNVLRWRK